MERLMPGVGTVNLFNEHQARYQFAGEFVQGKRVLDVACGTGIGTSYLVRAGASECSGVDISDSALQYAKRHYCGPRYLAGDVRCIPLRDEAVDVVVSFETIEHIREAGAFLAECRRVLAPGGLFIGSTPNDPVFRWKYPKENPFHLRSLSTREFSKLLSDHFRKVELYAQAPTIYPVMLAKQIGVRVLNALNATDVVLRMLGREDLIITSTASQYEPPRGETPIRPYRLSWLSQPTFSVVVAHR